MTTRAPRRRPRARSFGTVGVLRSGRFRARYTGPDGLQRSAPVTFATRREADAWLATVQADTLRGVWVAPERAAILLGEYVTTWQRQRAPRLKPRTRALYAALAARWLLAPVGQGRGAVDLSGVPLHALTPTLVREWFAAVSHAANVSASTSRRAPNGHPARAWALATGRTVAHTGRLPAAILAHWQRAGCPVVRPEPELRPDAGRTTAAQAYRLLHAVLAEAVTDGLLTSNPARIPGAGHVDHAERLPLSVAEVEALAREVPEHYRAAVLVATWSGLRPGETFALRRRDVDVTDAGTAVVHVRRTLVEVAGQPVTFGTPKTRAGRRTVALPPFVAEALAEHLRTHTGPDAEALVFTARDGGPVRSVTRSRVLSKPRARIGRPDITWHHLRHTGATLAAQAGATTAELQARIGHSTLAAASRYQHATAARDIALAHRLDALARPGLSLSVVRDREGP